MYSVYVLKSKNLKKFYTGQTNNFKKRLSEHNQGKVTCTKRYLPWVSVYKEDFKDRKRAVKREKYFKSAAGRRWLKNKFE